MEEKHMCDFGCGKEAKFHFKTHDVWCCSKHVNACEKRRQRLSESRLRGSKLFINTNNTVCSYGCGQIAKYTMANKKFCCEDAYAKCPAQKEINRIKQTGRKHSEETKKKISESNKGLQAGEKHPMFGKHRSEETRRKSSIAHKGQFVSKEQRKTTSEKLKQLYKNKENHPMFGKHHTLEARVLMSVIRKGRNCGEKHPLFGKRHSEEQRKRASERCKNLFKNKENHPMFGRKHSKETLEKMRTVKLGKVVCEETRKKLSIAGKKRGKRSEEWCRNISYGLMGKPRSEETKQKLRLKALGRPGRKYTEEQKEKSRQRLLNGHAAYMISHIKSPSKPQVELYNRIKSLYPSSILNYHFRRKKENRSYFLDVAIPELMICFESNGTRWHNKEKDLIRKQEVENEGWTMIEYHNVNYVKHVPTIEKIKEDIENVINYLKEGNYDKAQASS